MAQKCVHTGCGKMFTDADEVCTYHPGPPIFHEGQKGWKCCKPRVLTFDEFLEIPPCTEGKHSTTDLPPQVEKKAASVSDAELQRKIDAAVPKRKPIAVGAPKAGQAQHPNTTADGPATPPPPQPEQPPQDESDSDDPAVPVPEGRICRRRGCGVVYSGKDKEAWGEGVKCVHHPGHPIFHEGSKGYSCCKRRVLEFDQFMKIEGCRTKDRHLFVGSGKREKRKGRPGADGAADDAEGKGEDNEELLETVRNDFYQTPSTVIVSFFLKKIDASAAVVLFSPQTLTLDLPTVEAAPQRRKRYRAEVPLYAPIDAQRSTFKVLGSKLEVSLAKAVGDDGAVASWPVLRSDVRTAGQILQVGRAGRLQ